MSGRDEMRREARQDLVRVLAKQQVREGSAIPNMREAERKATEVADRNDRKKDR